MKTKTVKRAENACCCAGPHYNPNKPCPVHPKMVAYRENLPPVKRLLSGSVREATVNKGIPRDPTEPRLTWEKQSYKRYSAITGCGAQLDVVRSGRARLMNERWHPVVFGNQYAGPGNGFETVVEAMVFAETTAIAYARAALEALR